MYLSYVQSASFSLRIAAFALAILCVTISNVAAGTAAQAQLGAMRLDPKNATGGTDLYSRNFGWSAPLLSLPGRAGLNAQFGISYNSLVWLKDSTNNEIIFDPDVGNPSPGFQMGLPVIEGYYFNSSIGKYVFLMVNPDGSRTEFRRVSMGSAEFEAGDSSYRQLKITSGR